MQYGDKFKKSLFGGFNRQDVLKCFEEIDSEHQKALEDVKNIADSLQKNNDRLMAQINSFDAKLEEKDSLCARQSQSILALQEENKNLNAKIEELQREIATQKAISTKLSMSGRILEANNKTLKSKIEEYNSGTTPTATEVGEVMVEAKATANRIVARAKERSAQIEKTIKTETEQSEKGFDKASEKLETAITSFKNLSTSVVKNMEQLHRNLKIAKSNITGDDFREEKKSGVQEDIKKFFKSFM